MKASEIMSDSVAYCTPEVTVRQVAEMMKDFNCGAVPVVDNTESEEVLGLVTDRDIVCRTISNGDDVEAPVFDCMSSPPVTVHYNADVYECCSLMQNHKIRRLIVTDDHNKICGMITQTDLARKGNGMMASVLKEISRP